MKPLLLLLFSCFCLGQIKAQQEEEKTVAPEQLKPFRYEFPKRYDARILPDTSILLKELTMLKNKKPGVYRLPQDNMPCIVPDSTKTVQMPNAWKGPKRIPYQSNPPRMPNVSPKWVPSPITNTDSNAK
jgi:hypothetical protein